MPGAEQKKSRLTYNLETIKVQSFYLKLFNV
jgi:hypothetical protein